MIAPLTHWELSYSHSLLPEYVERYFDVQLTEVRQFQLRHLHVVGGRGRALFSFEDATVITSSDPCPLIRESRPMLAATRSTADSPVSTSNNSGLYTVRPSFSDRVSPSAQRPLLNQIVSMSD